MATIARRNIIVDFEVNSKKAQKQLNDVGKAATGLQSTLQTAAGTFAGLFAFDIAGRISGGLQQAASDVVNLAISAEQTAVAFETFLGSADRAKQVVAELNEFSKVTPFEPAEVIRAGKSLLAFGVAADDLVPTLKQIGDISAGLNINFNELAEIFGKAKVQGRLFAEDINQLTGRGIPIIAEFAKQFNVASSEVKKLVEEGKIGFPELQQAFTDLTSEGGRFFNLTAKQSETLGGKISTLRGVIDDFLRQLGEKLLPSLKSITQSLIDFFSAININTIISFGKALGVAVTAFVSYNTATKLANTLTNIFTASTIRARGAVATLSAVIRRNPFGLLVSVVSAAGAALLSFASDAEKAEKKQNTLNKAIEESIRLRQATQELEEQFKVIDALDKEQLETFLKRAEAELLANERKLRIIALAEKEFNEKIIQDREKADKELRTLNKKLGDDITIDFEATAKARNEANKKALDQRVFDQQESTRDEIQGFIDQNKIFIEEAKKRISSLDKIDEDARKKALKDLEKQRKIILRNEEKFLRDILKLRGSAEDDGEQDEKERNERRLAIIKDNEQQAIDILQKRITAIKKIQADILENEQLTAMEREELAEQTALRIARTELEILQLQLKSIFNTATDRISIEQAIQDKRAQIYAITNKAIADGTKKTTDDIVKKQLEAAKKIIDANEQLASAIIDGAKEVTQQRIDQLDRQIDAQRQAVENAALLAERGSAELLDVEERRLEELNNARQRAAEQYQAIAQLEVIANQALAVSQGIVAVTSAFATGNLVQGIATSISLAATVTAAIFALNNAFSDIPAFAEGTEYFDGVGGPKSDSNLARISRGERIVPADKNQKYFDTLNEFQNGSPMADYLHGIAQGNIPHVALDRRQKGSSSERNMLRQLEGINNRLDKLDISVRLDKNGFAASITRWAEQQNRLRNKLRS